MSLPPANKRTHDQDNISFAPHFSTLYFPLDKMMKKNLCLKIGSYTQKSKKIFRNQRQVENYESMI